MGSTTAMNEWGYGTAIFQDGGMQEIQTMKMMITNRFIQDIITNLRCLCEHKLKKVLLEIHIVG